jgi:hypothetical protein
MMMSGNADIDQVHRNAEVDCGTLRRLTHRVSQRKTKVAFGIDPDVYVYNGTVVPPSRFVWRSAFRVIIDGGASC